MQSSQQCAAKHVLGGATIRGMPLQHCRQNSRPASKLSVPRAVFGESKGAQTKPTVVPEPSFALPAVLGGIAAVSALGGAKIPAGLAGILAVFLAFQATRVRFRFEADALEVVLGEKESKSENKFVGGENRWKYDTFVNWEFWWPNFPVLVYFKVAEQRAIKLSVDVGFYDGERP